MKTNVSIKKDKNYYYVLESDCIYYCTSEEDLQELLNETLESETSKGISSEMYLNVSQAKRYFDTIQGNIIESTSIIKERERKNLHVNLKDITKRIEKSKDPNEIDLLNDKLLDIEIELRKELKTITNDFKSGIEFEYLFKINNESYMYYVNDEYDTISIYKNNVLVFECSNPQEIINYLKGLL